MLIFICTYYSIILYYAHAATLLVITTRKIVLFPLVKYLKFVKKLQNFRGVKTFNPPQFTAMYSRYINLAVS